MNEGKKAIIAEAKAKYKVLFVDDEEAMLHSLKRGLHSQGFLTLFTESAEEALKLLKENHDIGVVVSDLIMPGLNGIEFLREVGDVHSNVIKIVLTGNANVTNILATINETRIFKYLVKPCNIHKEIVPILEEALYVYMMNIKREELLSKDLNSITVKKNDNGLGDEQAVYFENVLEILKHAEDDVQLISKVTEKLTFLERATLEKLSLDIYSRSQNIYSSLVSISNVIEYLVSQIKNEE